MAKTKTPSNEDPYTGEKDEGSTGPGRGRLSSTPYNTDPYTDGTDKGQTYKVSPEEAIQRTHRDRK